MKIRCTACGKLYTLKIVTGKDKLCPKCRKKEREAEHNMQGMRF